MATKNALKQRTFKTRQRDKGLVRCYVWVPESRKLDLMKFAESLTEQKPKTSADKAD